MKRLNKLYEAVAIVSNAHGSMSIALNRLGLNKADRDRLKAKCAALDTAAKDLATELESMVVECTGNTTKVLWENAARNTGRPRR